MDIEFLLRDFEEKVREHQSSRSQFDPGITKNLDVIRDAEQAVNLARLDLRRALGLPGTTIQVPQGTPKHGRARASRNSE